MSTMLHIHSLVFYPAKSLNPFCLQTNLSSRSHARPSTFFLSLYTYCHFSYHNIHMCTHTHLNIDIAIIVKQTDNLCGVWDLLRPDVQSTRRYKANITNRKMFKCDPSVRHANPKRWCNKRWKVPCVFLFLSCLSSGPLNYDSGR